MNLDPAWIRIRIRIEPTLWIRIRIRIRIQSIRIHITARKANFTPILIISMSSMSSYKDYLENVGEDW